MPLVCGQATLNHRVASNLDPVQRTSCVALFDYDIPKDHETRMFGHFIVPNKTHRPLGPCTVAPRLNTEHRH